MCVRPSETQLNISAAAVKNFLLWGMIIGYDVGLIAWYRRHTEKNVSERFPCYKDMELNTAANLHSALLPLLTHKGMLAHCKQGLEWLACFKHIY